MLHVKDLSSEYDVVVVGSGYGGSVAAARAAEAGQQVCLLERGREYRSGDFDGSLLGYATNSTLITNGSVVGPADALHRFTIKGDLNVYSGCGVGGGSLINAGVALRPDPRIFATAAWPQALQDAGELSSYYETASSMLGVKPYPNHFANLAKVEALRQGSEGSSANFFKPPLTISFSDEVNEFGVKRRSCQSCGQCTAGCNHAAKNSLDTNYLPYAKRHGAQIFAGVSVLRVERIAGNPQRWAVLCIFKSEAGESIQRRILSRVVVIAAGTLGTNEIMQRSRQAGLTVSSCLGKRFSGNGDLLAYVHGSKLIDLESRKDAAVGPCITAVHDARFTSILGEGIMIQEGIPANGAAFAAKSALALSLAQEKEGPLAAIADFARHLTSLATPSFDKTLSLLAQTQDSADGELILQDEHVHVKWPHVDREPFVERVQNRMDRIARQLGGDLVRQPGKLTTVHPLGGCVMAEDAGSGAVDHRGRVFSGSSGTEVHDGLYVFDASVIPMALGVNTLLTITALAERAAALMIKERCWSPGPLKEIPRSMLPAKTSAPIGMHFTESMRGFITTAVQCSYEDAEQRGQSTQNTCAFTLTAYSNDMETFFSGEQSRLQVSGFVVAPGLSSEPLRVLRGFMELFHPDEDDPRTQCFLYHLDLETEQGANYVLKGRKFIRKDHRLTIGWKETTTLYIDIFANEAFEEQPLARGILRLNLLSFLGQMSTMRFTGDAEISDRLRTARRFFGFFAGKMVETFGGGFTALRADKHERKIRPLRAPTPDHHSVVTGDGIELPLYRYRGGSKGPVVLFHAGGVSARMFFLDTVETNLVEFLVAAGYDVWVGTYRTSIKRPKGKELFGFDDIAHHDHPATIAKILELSGEQDVQIVGFCAGSMSVLMSLLAGHLSKQVRSMVCLQTALHFEPPKSKLMDLKLSIGLAPMLEALGVHELPNSIGGKKTHWDKLWDVALSLHPYPGNQQCTSRTCQRSSFVFGNLLQHEQLNRATHETLSELWDPTSIGFVKRSAKFFETGFVVDESGQDVYLPQAERLALPISFLHGTKNGAYGQGTEKTFHYLCARNGDHFYERHLLPGYGHLDAVIGKNAAGDVYPLVLEFLERTAGSVEVPQAGTALGKYQTLCETSL